MRVPILQSMRISTVLTSLVAVAALGGCWSDAGPPDLSLKSRGTATASLDGVADFQPLSNGSITCQSDQGRKRAEQITAPELGELRSGTLRAFVNPFAGESAETNVRIEMFIDGSDLPSGSAQPSWTAIATVISMAADGTKGRVSFAADAQPQSADGSGGIPAGWPARLEGEFSWACNAWHDPDANPALGIPATLDLHLTAVTWIPLADAQPSCDGEEFGGIGGVTAFPAGTLQGQRFAIGLDLYGELRVGGQARLSITAIGEKEGTLPSAAVPGATPTGAPGPKDTPGAPAYLPSWDGPITVTEVSADDASGRATFTDIPTGASSGIQSPGWPETLSGEITWHCDG